MSASEKWVIIDWAGNLMFNGKEFASFDDGDAFLDEHFEKHGLNPEEERQEFEVITLAHWQAIEKRTKI